MVSLQRKNHYSNEDEAYLRTLKPWLILRVGDVVYLKSDIKHKTPMTVAAIFWNDDEHDCRCEWLNQQKRIEYGLFNQDSLLKQQDNGNNLHQED